MVSIFVMLIVAIALVAGIGFATLTLIRSGEASLSIQKNQVIVETSAAAIRGTVSHADGGLLVPVMLDGAGIPLARMPSTAPYRETAYGRPLVYCPVGDPPEFAEDGDVKHDPAEEGMPALALPYAAWHREGPSGGSYVTAVDFRFPADAEEETGPESEWTGGVAVAERMRELGIAAFILSSPPNDPSLPDCRDVRFADPEGDSGILITDSGASVTAVFAFRPAGQASHFIVTSQDPLPEGGWPRTARRAATLDEVAAEIEGHSMADATVHLPDADVYNMSADAFAGLLAQPHGRAVRFAGSDDFPGIQVDEVPPGGFEITSDVSFDRVLVAAASPASFAVRDGGRAFFIGSAVGDVEVDGGHLSFEGGPADALYVRSGIARLAEAQVGAASVSGGELAVRDGMSFGSRIDVRGGRLVLDTGAVAVADAEDWPFAVSGGGSVSSDGIVTVTTGGPDSPVSYKAGDVRVERTCNSASSSCAAQCGQAKKAVAGSCLFPGSGLYLLRQSGASAQGGEWFCEWSTHDGGPIATTWQRQSVAICADAAP